MLDCHKILAVQIGIIIYNDTCKKYVNIFNSTNLGRK